MLAIFCPQSLRLLVIIPCCPIHCLLVCQFTRLLVEMNVVLLVTRCSVVFVSVDARLNGSPNLRLPPLGGHCR